MKKNLCTITLLFIFSFVRAQDCNIGNEDTTGYDNNYGPYSANYLMGFSFNLAAAGTLQSINIMGFVPGSPVQMAVYTDASGAPGNLISSSAIDTVVAGINSFPVTPMLLNPGDYWVMAVFGVSEISVCHNSQQPALIYYIPLTFGNALPATGAGFMNNTVVAAAFFLEILCLSSGETTIEARTETRIYPNPAFDFIYVSASENDKQYSISDLHGRLVAQGMIRNNNEAIEIKSLSSGIYFVKVIEGDKVSVAKIVKE